MEPIQWRVIVPNDREEGTWRQLPTEEGRQLVASGTPAGDEAERIVLGTGDIDRVGSQELGMMLVEGGARFVSVPLRCDSEMVRLLGARLLRRVRLVLEILPEGEAESCD